MQLSESQIRDIDATVGTPVFVLFEEAQYHFKLRQTHRQAFQR